MTLVIKTTVAVSDTGTSKHQCVTMRTKDLRECLFLKRFLCIKAVVKRFTFQNQVHIRLRIRFYLKILNDNRKYSNVAILIHSCFFFKKSIYRKSTKVFLNLSKLPVFNPKYLIDSFGSFTYLPFQDLSILPSKHTIF